MITNSVFSFLDEDEGLIPKDILLQASIGEYANVVECGEYKGVEIDALDMSSGAKTGTFKDWVACATIAYCKYNNVENFVTQSSGNTANAIAAYCTEFDHSATIFYMKGNADKLKPQFFDGGSIKAVAVDGEESYLKEVTRKFSDNNDIPWLPNLDIQDFSNSIRANYVLKYCMLNNKNYDWHSQSLSSGYGVFGFYNGLRRLGRDSGFKFLGVQQSVISPFIKIFRNSEYEGVDFSGERLIEKTLFRSSPTEELYKRMGRILAEYGGSFSMVTNDIYGTYLERALYMLNESGIQITRNSNGEIVEKSGLIDLIGVMRAIDSGVVCSGESILISITGGSGAAPFGSMSPSMTID